MIFENNDVPGIVGQIGTLLGNHQINIADMSLSRGDGNSRALTVLNLDSLPSDEVLQAALQNPNIRSVHLVQF
jgi:D-3-phosphoglycerate dehydrogenase